MILHTCPHCKAGNLYGADLQGSTNCHSCGVTFELSRFTRNEKDAVVRVVENIRANAQSARQSRLLIYFAASLGFAVIAWAAVSTFGLIPDEWRMFNRRFAGISDQHRLAESVGFVAVGTVVQPGKIAFQGFGTAVAVTNDGYLLTCKHVLPKDPIQRIWVYLNGRRLDARVVGSGSVSDWALLKVDDRLRYRFRLAPPGKIGRLNVDVVALGFQEMLADVDSQVTSRTIAKTIGSVSRIYTDNIGTEWIEHTAVLTGGSSGGPLLVDDVVVGVNTGGARGIFRALSIGPLRDRIWRMIEQSREVDSGSSIIAPAVHPAGANP